MKREDLLLKQNFLIMPYTEPYLVLFIYDLMKPKKNTNALYERKGISWQNLPRKGKLTVHVIYEVWNFLNIRLRQLFESLFWICPWRFKIIWMLSCPNIGKKMSNMWQFIWNKWGLRMHTIEDHVIADFFIHFRLFYRNQASLTSSIWWRQKYIDKSKEF